MRRNRPYIPDDLSFLKYPNDEWMFMPEKWEKESTRDLKYTKKGGMKP